MIDSAVQQRIEASKRRERKDSLIDAAGLLLSGLGFGVCVGWAAVGLGDLWLAGGLAAVLVVRVYTEMAGRRASTERAYQHMELVLALDREQRQ